MVWQSEMFAWEPISDVEPMLRLRTIPRVPAGKTTRRESEMRTPTRLYPFDLGGAQPPSTTRAAGAHARL